jgi:hypothetical protein
MLIECKSGSLDPNDSLKRYAEIFRTEKNFQLVAKAPFRKFYSPENISVIDYETFFSGMV